VCGCCSSDNSLSKCKIALFTLFAGKWGIRKEGNITVATKEGRIYNEVFCSCIATSLCFWLKSITILHIKEIPI